ncbi:MAG: hypothetical protein A2X86_20310 [Bdellovibrionales bacterium GWA2_49_15]|nr:MAG: hypothetical protein A2X86_20310 [Bdellovibrionales bacterium GWA2_49_15]HAZ11342.1 hypothetical protein [Bdellovibrionales bacterium]
MNLKHGLVFFLLFSAVNANAKSESTFTKSYNQIKKDLASKITICRKQFDKNVKKAYSESKKPYREQEHIQFVKDEKKALQFINGFDLSKLTDVEEQKFYTLISEQCSKENLIIFEKLDKKRRSCNFFGEEYKFMKGLIYAQKNYDWSEQTRQLARGKILEWVQNQANPDHYITQLFALELLELMVEYGQIDKKFGEEIKQTYVKAEKRHLEIKEAIQLISKNDKKSAYFSCEGFSKSRELEIPFSQTTSEEIKVILQKI